MEQDNSFIDGPLALSLLREEGKAELFEIFESLRGRKCLVLQQQLGGILNQIIPEGSKLLKEKGVQYFRELRTELGDFSSETGRDFPDNIIYLVRPVLPLMKVIASQIQTCLKAGNRCQFHIYFVPNRTVACEQLLEDEGVLEHTEIGEYHLGMIPFDNDLLSLEMDGVFRQCYVDGDTSALNAVSRAICRIQNLYGIIPSVKSKGAASRKVLQKMLHMRREEDSGATSGTDIAQRSEIDCMILLDREVDLVSALVTPLTYEGLVDEVIGIDNGRIKVDASLLGDEKDETAALAGGMGAAAAALGLQAPTLSTTSVSGGGGAGGSNPSTGEGGKSTGGTSSATPARKPGDKVAINLNSGDSVFLETRGLSIERLGSFLQEKAISIKGRYASFRDNKDASITEIHDFVKKIPALTREFKCLQRHINVAELVKVSTDSREFRQLWQGERGILEGELFLDQIEDLICADSEKDMMWKAMRLLCLHSLTAGGIRTSRLEPIKRLVVQAYGFDHLFTLANLEKAGLLRTKDGLGVGLGVLGGGLDASSPFSVLKRNLRLISESADDVSYVTAGYAPLTARLVQLLGMPGPGGGWAGGVGAEAMRLLPGPLIEISQLSHPEELSEAISRTALEASHSVSPHGEESRGGLVVGGTKKVLLVVVVGGLTYTEIAALRHVSKDPSFPYTIIMATTKLVNGSSLLKSLAHDFKA